MKAILACVALLLCLSATGVAAERGMSRVKGPVEDFKAWCNAIPTKFNDAVKSVDDTADSVGKAIESAGTTISNAAQASLNAVKAAANEAAAPLVSMMKDLEKLLAKLGEYLLQLLPGPLKEIGATLYEYIKREASGGFDDVKLTWGSMAYIKKLHDDAPFGVPDYVWKRVAFLLNGVPSVTGRHDIMLRGQVQQAALIEELEELKANALQNPTPSSGTTTTTTTTLPPTTTTTKPPLYKCKMEGDVDDQSTVNKKLNSYENKKTSCSIMLATSTFFDSFNNVLLGFTSALDDSLTAAIQFVAWGVSTVLIIIAAALRGTCALGGWF